MCHREIEHTQVVFVPEVKCTRKLEQASSGIFFGANHGFKEILTLWEWDWHVRVEIWLYELHSKSHLQNIEEMLFRFYYQIQNKMEMLNLDPLKIYLWTIYWVICNVKARAILANIGKFWFFSFPGKYLENNLVPKILAVNQKLYGLVSSNPMSKCS